MTQVHQLFNRFLDSVVRFSGAEQEQAGRSQAYLRERLQTYAAEHPDFPNFLDGDFLSGSFGRKTAIRPLDDVDIFLILDGTRLVVSQSGVQLPDTVEGSGHLPQPILSDDYESAAGYVSSVKVLNAFRDALRDSIYPRSEVGRDQQAVNVWLEAYDMGLDVVPAFHVTDPAGSDRYLIPAGHGNHEWLSTNPKLDVARLLEVGGAAVSKLRDVIRVARYWNQEVNHDRLGGYHVEVMTLNILDSYAIDQRRDALEYLFDRLPQAIQQQCPSQTGFGDNVDAYLTDDERRRSMEAATLAARAIRGANAAEAEGAHDLAAKFWRIAMGDAFPKQ